MIPFSKKQSGSIFSNRHLALMSGFLLCLIGIGLIILEVLFLPQWVHSGVIMTDFYIYIVVTGCVSMFSMIAVVTIWKRSLSGMYHILLVLCGVCIVQFVAGLVHIGLLYQKYQTQLVEACIRRQPPGAFWWSFGYQSMDDIHQSILHCERDWGRFSAVRVACCFTFALIATLCLLLMIKYYRRSKKDVRSDLDKMVDASWDSETLRAHEEEKQPIRKDELPTNLMQSSQKEKEANKAIAFEKHNQRQKLYEKITKRQRQKRRERSRTGSAVSSPRHSGRFSHLYHIHPFDAPVEGHLSAHHVAFDDKHEDMTQHSDVFEAARSRRSSRRHRKLSLSHPSAWAGLPVDDTKHNLGLWDNKQHDQQQTSSSHEWARHHQQQHQQQQHQHDDSDDNDDETKPLNPFEHRPRTDSP
ncbi:uncharacterized protein BX664DRAFT_361616 [Halteromyces radiatus]|uniref:uncharacterized protein n=1 Tax=Halteromyces radiatus TaxID=101107 RepID=UPI00222038D8|nr:uncharacterized protein BX664DRAFT_361616 [Halteromyces radiatus]KAI8081455.1 hypothetical protein BX664DRAFT_361616 [Halteromyces radiatus]